MIVEEKLSDARGLIYKLELRGAKVNLLFSKAGTYRAGDFHPNEQLDAVLSGMAIIKLHKVVGEETVTLKPHEVLWIKPKVPHLFYFPEDTVMLEWWDGPFSAEYYEPYRSIVERQRETGEGSASLAQDQREALVGGGE